MLYAYRWQVELCFRFIKRTLKGIHLMCYNPRGVQIQFYLYMVAYLLLLSFKQECEISQNPSSENVSAEEVHQATYSNSDNSPQPGRFYVCGLVSLLGRRLKKYWKIGVHWLIAVKNYLAEIFNDNIAQNLAAYP
ncbi:MAG: transposase [Deltaproteobacteria bacterium]|nr:transposase [Deltaproteobacteria bacterium]